MSIGVAPACDARPLNTAARRSTPTVPSTAAADSSRASSTGPCSMCSSRYARAPCSCEPDSCTFARSTS